MPPIAPKDVPGHLMSEIVQDGPNDAADEELALDYVLDILVEPLRSLAERRKAQEPAFARLIAKHIARLTELDGTGTARDISPLPQSWDAIRARIADKPRH